MAAGVRVAITLACTECKRRNYQTNKSKRNTPDRVEFKKYCRWCGNHTRAPGDALVARETRRQRRDQRKSSNGKPAAEAKAAPPQRAPARQAQVRPEHAAGLDADRPPRAAPSAAASSRSAGAS